MTPSEVIAYLDTLERELLGLSRQVRELRATVFEGLDSDHESLLD